MPRRMKCVRGQKALFSLVTRTIPPWRLFDGDTAIRDAEVRRARGAASIDGAKFQARHIVDWPHWPGGNA